MIKYFEAFAGIGAFRSAFEKTGGLRGKPTERCMTQGGEFFMRTSQKSITEVCRILICSSADRAASPSASRGAEKLLRMTEETSFSTISKSLKPSSPVTLSLKTYPICLVYRRGNVSESSLKRFLNWGIVCAGECLTLPDSGYRSQEEGCSLSDILETDVPQKYWLSEEMMRKIAKKENLNS